MSKLALYKSVIGRVDFYLSQYRFLSKVMLVMGTILFLAAAFALRIALKPHHVPSIITTVDGRLLKPAKIYFAQGIGTYFWRFKNV